MDKLVYHPTRGIPFEKLTYPGIILGFSWYLASLYLFFDLLQLVFPPQWKLVGWKLTIASFVVAVLFNRLIDRLISTVPNRKDTQLFRNGYGFFATVSLNTFISMLILLSTEILGTEPTVELAFALIVPIFLFLGAICNALAATVIFTKLGEDDSPITIFGIVIAKLMMGVTWLISWIPLVFVTIEQVKRLFGSAG